MKICSWCNKPILLGEPTIKDGDGDIVHLICSVEEDDGNDIDNEIASR